MRFGYGFGSQFLYGCVILTVWHRKLENYANKLDLLFDLIHLIEGKSLRLVTSKPDLQVTNFINNQQYSSLENLCLH